MGQKLASQVKLRFEGTLYKGQSLLLKLFLSVTIGVLFLLSATIAGQAEWQTICQKKTCTLQNQIINPESRKVLARISMRRLTEADMALANSEAENEMFAVLFLPLGVHIPTGVTVIIKEDMLLKASLLDCTDKYGCRAVFSPTKEVLEEMGKQKAITVSAVFTEEAKQMNFAFMMDDFAEQLNTFHRPKP